MRAAILALLAVLPAASADDPVAALALKAKSAFDRASALDRPRLAEASECVQAQAAVLPVASREDTPLVYFRKGYCGLMAASVAQNPAGFREAAAAFDQATTNWQARGKPAPSVLMALSGIARLGADGPEDPGAREDLAVGVARNTCAAELMTAAACQAVFRTGREWLGWMALRRNDAREAARQLGELPDSPWARWASGKQDFAAGRYGEAALAYAASLELWRTPEDRWRTDWISRLGPRPEIGQALADLGGAQLLAGQASAAIATLDAAIAADSKNARACYLRARARELAGQAEAAAADYSLAMRMALAGAEDLVSGEAHLYRGILLYRRKDFSRAEDEFSSALNAAIAADMRPDAVAWRHLAAVAGGACRVSRKLLEESLAAVSPYFPKSDAAAAVAACANSL